MNNITEDHAHTISSSSRQERVEGSSSRPLIIHDVGGRKAEGSGDQKQKKKKRSKLIRLGGGTDQHRGSSSRSVNGYVRPKSAVKKPEPNAPKITPPCSECGRRFWSSKALFGHMRCHPERQWRGINPPPNFRKPGLVVDQGVGRPAVNTEEDYICADNLMVMANGSHPTHTQSMKFNSGSSSEEVEDFIGEAEKDLGSVDGVVDGIVPSSSNNRFECSSCKKVFPSHQALGGHRASHKNIKGCFALARTDNDQTMEIEQNYYMENVYRDVELEWKAAAMDLGHRCGICFRVFPSGQALGGHMRCHWEKDHEDPSLLQGLIPFNNATGDGQGLIPFGDTEGDVQGLIPLATAPRDLGDLDLNFPPPPPSPETTHRDASSSSSSTPSSAAAVGLDLRLGM